MRCSHQLRSTPAPRPWNSKPRIVRSKSTSPATDPSKSGDRMVFGASASRTCPIRRIDAAIKGGPVRDRRGTRFTLEGRGAADTFAVPIEARLHPKTIWFLVERGAPTRERLDFFHLNLARLRPSRDGRARLRKHHRRIWRTQGPPSWRRRSPPPRFATSDPRDDGPLVPSWALALGRQ